VQCQGDLLLEKGRDRELFRIEISNRQIAYALASSDPLADLSGDPEDLGALHRHG
jgi:hypothetical protein